MPARCPYDDNSFVQVGSRLLSKQDFISRVAAKVGYHPHGGHHAGHQLSSTSQDGYHSSGARGYGQHSHSPISFDPGMSEHTHLNAGSARRVSVQSRSHRDAASLEYNGASAVAAAAQAEADLASAGASQIEAQAKTATAQRDKMLADSTAQVEAESKAATTERDRVLQESTKEIERMSHLATRARDKQLRDAEEANMKQWTSATESRDKLMKKESDGDVARWEQATKDRDALMMASQKSLEDEAAKATAIRDCYASGQVECAGAQPSSSSAKSSTQFKPSRSRSWSR